MKALKGSFIGTNKGLMIECGGKLYELSQEMKDLEQNLMNDSDRLLNLYLDHVTNETELMFVNREIKRREK